MKVDVSWEDDNCCGLNGITCDCGHKDKSPGHPVSGVVRDGYVWNCEKCGKKIRFQWIGMTWEEVKNEVSA